ncbi:helix-turn-helix transcriptional regulator, partial [Desulfovulcanus sp.]
MKWGQQCKLAKKIGISPQYLNPILKGKRRANPKLAVRLEQETGISRMVWVWGTPEEIRAALDEVYPVGEGDPVF